MATLVLRNTKGSPLTNAEVDANFQNLNDCLGASGSPIIPSPIGRGAQGANGNQIFFENDTNVTASYTITSGKNAMTAGPITVNSGVVVTVPTGSSWTIV